MDPIKNLSTGFNTALKTAASDNVINKKELETLKKEAKTDDDKAVVSLLAKDTKNVSFNINEGNAQKNYSLSLDLDEPKPESKTNKPIAPFTASYATLGEGDKTKASNVMDQPWVARPTEGLDQVVNKFKTPEQVASLLGSIPYDDIRGQAMGGDGPLGAMSPDDTLKKYTGVCRDIHQLGAYLLSKNGYEAIQMGYVGARTSHSITVYKEPGGKGYGIVEYGKVYSPDKIKEMLGGRFANSPEEAVNALNFGTATTIYKWTPPKEGQEGHVEGAFYTEKYQNYHKTLQLQHQDGISFDSQLGLQIEKTLSDKWSIAIGKKFDTPGDPTAKDAVHATVGFKTGNENNWFSASLGAQYRPNDGARIVGTTDWSSTPTILAGASVQGQVRPLNYEFAKGHFTSTTVTGNMSGAFLAFNAEKESDAGTNKNSEKKSFDMDYVSTLPKLNIGVEQNVYGNFGNNLSYRAGAFMDYNGALAVAGISMGAKNPMEFANIGANARLVYEKGPLELGAGGQVMFQSVDNLHPSAVGVDAKYNIGNLTLSANSSMLFNTVEGNRLMTGVGAQYNISNKVNIGAGYQNELIMSRENGVYSNPGSNAFNIKAGFNF